MKIALGAMVLLLASACSGESGDPSSERSSEPTSKPSSRSPSASPSASPSESPKPPRRRLRAAQLALSRTTGGAYDLAVWIRGADEPLLTEDGRFDVLHEVLELERTIPKPKPKDGQQSSFVLRVRSSAKARFAQMDDWGPWEGCWLELGPELNSALGVDLSTIPNIPVPVSLVLDARLVPQDKPVLARPGGTPSVVPAASVAAEDSITVHTDGLTALQMFGVTGAALFELDPAVARAKVPATLTFFEKYPDIVEQVSIEGSAAAAALRNIEADLNHRLMSFVRSAWAGVTFHPDVIPVSFLRPAPETLLPTGATRDQTCPANLD